MAWMKLHTDILDDVKKTRKLSPNSFHIFIFLMLFAKELDANGEINLPLKDIEWRLRVEPEILQTGIADLVGLKILSNKHSTLKFINWSKRNYADSTKRVKKHRLKRYNETLHCNDIETPTRAREQNRTETETETETEKKTTLVSHDKIVFDFSSFSFQNITEDFLQRARESFPAVDVDAEIKRAARWLEANPSKRKKNYARFLTNWFARTQERGGSANRNGSDAVFRDEHVTYTDINAYRRAKKRGEQNISLSRELREKYPGE
jgi:hypothetical protein